MIRAALALLCVPAVETKFFFQKKRPEKSLCRPARGATTGGSEPGLLYLGHAKPLKNEHKRLLIIILPFMTLG